MADVKDVKAWSDVEKAILLQACKMKIASLDRAANGYPLGSNMYMAVREDITAVKRVIDKIGGL